MQQTGGYACAAADPVADPFGVQPLWDAITAPAPPLLVLVRPRLAAKEEEPPGYMDRRVACIRSTKRSLSSSLRAWAPSTQGRASVGTFR